MFSASSSSPLVSFAVDIVRHVLKVVGPHLLPDRRSCTPVVGHPGDDGLVQG